MCVCAALYTYIATRLSAVLYIYIYRHHMKQTYMKLFIPPNIGLVVPADLRTNRQLENCLNKGCIAMSW